MHSHHEKVKLGILTLQHLVIGVSVVRSTSIGAWVNSYPLPIASILLRSLLVISLRKVCAFASLYKPVPLFLQSLLCRLAAS